ncbi:MAG: hypothetical protein ACP6IY_09000 [Promethearchaeia archaeon]
MNNSKTAKDIEKLTKILSKVQMLYYRKKEQLEELKDEINDLKKVLDLLNSLISEKSFTSADDLYFQSLSDPEKFFTEKIAKEKIQGTQIKRKIFASDDNSNENLLSILEFNDMSNVFIKFIDPKMLGIKETSEQFIAIFLKEALVRIIEENPNLYVKYNFCKDSDIIESIEIKNLRNIKEFDLITAKVRELVLKSISKGKYDE